jgi:hypothetical protein
LVKELEGLSSVTPEFENGVLKFENGSSGSGMWVCGLDWAGSG